MVVGYDPVAETQKFTVPFDVGFDGRLSDTQIIAGDGYFYMPYSLISQCGGNCILHDQRVLWVNSTGAFDDIDIVTWQSTVTGDPYFDHVNLITNADTGVFMTIQTDCYASGVTWLATTVGAAVGSLGQVVLPNLSSANSCTTPGITAELQAQDGSFVGRMSTPTNFFDLSYMIGFDAAGRIRWSVPNETPMIATADGGVIGKSGVAYDQNGSAVTRNGNLQIQSWNGYASAG